MAVHVPKFLIAKKNGLLEKKIKQAESLLSPCVLCPRQCRVDRIKKEKGYCQTGENASLSSFSPHFGEEPPLVGDKGSGTIFFSHCNLRCVFCQNYEISIEGHGREVNEDELASVMITLQKAGCCNINVVTPSHVVPQILKALDIASEMGLRLPLVYNCSGYESLETLKILRDVVDIYMPDFKFWNPMSSKKYCHAEDYPKIVRSAMIEMHSQVGDLCLDESGLAVSGLLVRHLVMPGLLSETKAILAFLKDRISPLTHVNIMSQYHPEGEARNMEELCHPLSTQEFRRALQMGRELGLTLVR